MKHFIEKIPGLYFLDEDGVLIWLLTGQEKAMLVDTGYGTVDFKAEAAKVTDLPVFLVNTHMHPDHAGGNYQFEIAYCGENEPTTNYGIKPAKKTIFIEEGHIFDLGGITVEVIDISGHTPGSIGLLWVEKKIILSGDSINPQVWMHLPNSKPLSVFRDSMQHLIDLKKKWDVLYFSHGEGDLEFDLDTVKTLKKAADDVISGKKVGTKTKTHLGDDAMLYKDNGIGFCYDPEKLT